MTKPRFTARQPVDLIALAPVVLGFHPEDSVVLLTFGATQGRQFHARVDLPAPDDLDEVIRLLVDPVLSHRIPDAALLIYSDDVQLTAATASRLVTALKQAGCRVVDVLRVDDDHYDRPLQPEAAPVPYDIASHEFTAQAVFLGRQMMPSRAELADQLVGGSVEEMDEIAAAAADLASHRQGGLAERRWIRSTLRSWLDAPAPLSADECGALVQLLSEVELRDVAWDEITPETCSSMRDFWIQVVRRCPDELLPAPAALLALSAWLSGDGAMSWCAVDRCLEQDPDYSLGHLVSGLLERAVPPQVWWERHSRPA